MTNGPSRREILCSLGAVWPALLQAAPTPTQSTGANTMRTHAVGRHLIDLPEGFLPLAGNRVDLYFGLDKEAPKVKATLLANSVSSAALMQRVAERRAALATDRHEVLAKPMLILDQNRVAGRVHLLRSYEDGLLAHVLRSEVFCHVGDALLHLEAISYRVAPDAAEARLLAVALGASPAGIAGAGGPGFSLGPLILGSDHRQEIATLHFKHPDAGDLLFTLEINALTATPVPGLLARWDKNSATFLQGLGGGLRTLRRGPTSMADMAGEELLTRGTISGRTVFKFNAESRRDHPAFATPLMTVMLDTEPVGPAERWPVAQWAEGQAVAAWDRVIRSIKLRPGAV